MYLLKPKFHTEDKLQLLSAYHQSLFFHCFPNNSGYHSNNNILYAIPGHFILNYSKILVLSPGHIQLTPDNANFQGKTKKIRVICGKISGPVTMYRQPAILPHSVNLLAAYSRLVFTRSPVAGKGTWHLLPTAPSMLPTATEHFDRAELVTEWRIYVELAGGSSYQRFELSGGNCTTS